jgi:hypothetical protein
MSVRRVARTLALALALSVFAPAIASAQSSIEQIVPKNLTPQTGSSTTFQVAVSPADNTGWDAGTYTITLIAADPTGSTVATSAPFTADQPATPAQTTMLFVDLQLPNGYVGPLVVHAHLDHGKTSEDSLPAGIVVGGSAGSAAANVAVVPAASPAPGQVPAPGGAPPSPSPSSAPAGPLATAAPTRQPAQYSGSLSANQAYGPAQTESGVLNVSGKFANNASITAAAGLANTPGNQKPLITFQTSTLLASVGTISPTFDRDAFAGPTGTGISLKTTWDNSLFALQGAAISGNHDTVNPYEMEALSYGFPLWGSPAELTGGYEDIYGPSQPGPFFLRDGTFLGFGDDVHAPHSSFTYGVHYGFTLYHDDLNDIDRSGDVFDFSLGFKINKAQVSMTYVRGTPYFANASAPGVTPDRETETAAVTVPLGVLQVTLGATVYRDDLPGSTVLQTTHYATENLGITDPLKNGDVLSFQAVNGVQHQTGDPVSPFSGNDGTTFAYTTKRGAYALQYTLADTETRDNAGDLLHVVTNGVTVSRAPFANLTISGGFNLNENDANVAAQTMLSNSVTGSVSYTLGGLTLSSQINQSLTHPFVGIAAAPTLTYNYGISVKPRRIPYSISATVTENIGAMNSSTGALSINRQF